MVYQRFMKRGGKTFGPYLYKSKLFPDGKIKSIYVGKNDAPIFSPTADVLSHSPVFNQRIALLEKNIRDCEAKKESVKGKAAKLLQHYNDGLISYSHYELMLNKLLIGKPLEFWLDYYNNYNLRASQEIQKLQTCSSLASYIRQEQKQEPEKKFVERKDELSDYVQQLVETKFKALEEKLKDEKAERHSAHLSYSKTIAVFAVLCLLFIPSFFLVQNILSEEASNVVLSETPNAIPGEKTAMFKVLQSPRETTAVEITSSERTWIEKILGRFASASNLITGMAVDDAASPDSLATKEVSDALPAENIAMPFANVTAINLTETNITLPENISMPLFEETMQMPAEINELVGWIKEIRMENRGKVRVELPEEATNITVTTIDNGSKVEIPASNLRIGKTQNKSKVLIQEDITVAEIIYYTEAPLIEEKQINERVKHVTISSALDYANITSYTDIAEMTGDANMINLYWLVNGTKQPVESALFVDTNGNGLIDKVEWAVTHLSNQTYEINISIINVQSYPSVGGNWTVLFNTTGTANLTIRAFNGTTWSNYSDTDNDLKFLEVRCGSFVKQYEWKEEKTLIPDYNCSNTGVEVSKVLTSGKHTLEFDFGGMKAYAFNTAVNNILANYANIYTKEWSTDGGSHNCAIGSLDTDNGIYCGNGTNFDPTPEFANVNSTHPYAVPLTATMGSVFICTQFNLTGSLDNAGDFTNISVGENSTGTWKYTTVDTCISSGCTAWETEAMRCYNVSSTINYPNESRSIQIVVASKNVATGNNQQVLVEMNYVNISYSEPNTDYPLFSGAIVNNTLLGNNQWARFNITVSDATDTISAVNGTINGVNQSFTSSGVANIWFYDYQCTASDSVVGFTAAWANDTGSLSNANTTAISGVSTNCDAVAPQITSARINATSDVATGTVVKVNASIIDPESNLWNVTLSITPPISPPYNITPSQNGNEFYNDSIILSEAGKWVFRFYANDTAGNLNVSNATDLAGNQYIQAAESNVAPIIYYFSAISPQSITESGVTNVPFVVSVLDANGIETIRNSSSMNASAALSGETTRTNLSCERMYNINATAANYSCTLNIWYWDAGGDWTVNISTNDTSGAIANTKNTTFTLGVTNAIVSAPQAISWENLYTNSKNITATNDPIIINNTANTDITIVNITGVNLGGVTITTERLLAGSFIVNHTFTGGSPPAECSGYILVNGTGVPISGAVINSGNNTGGYGNVSIYFCMTNISTGISVQTYSTTDTGKWVIGVK